MIVGKTGAGKSEAWKCLTRAMARLKKLEPDNEQYQKAHHVLHQGAPCAALEHVVHCIQAHHVLHQGAPCAALEHAVRCIGARRALHWSTLCAGRPTSTDSVDVGRGPGRRGRAGIRYQEGGGGGGFATVLLRALLTPEKFVHVHTINPLALSNDELYGCFDSATHEWQDGVLARIMRTVCKDESPDQKWILFDGPVDTLWIESMNTTLDDNKLLTLLSGERIAMPPQVCACGCGGARGPGGEGGGAGEGWNKFWRGIRREDKEGGGRNIVGGRQDGERGTNKWDCCTNSAPYRQGGGALQQVAGCATRMSRHDDPPGRPARTTRQGDPPACTARTVQAVAPASPATVSRAGMIFFNTEDLGWWPMVTSWLGTKSDAVLVDALRKHIDKYIEPALEYKRHNCKELVPTDRLSCVRTFMRLFDSLATPENGVSPEEGEHYGALIEMWFLFCIAWGLGGQLTEDGRKKFDAFMREMDTRYPAAETVFDYFIEPKERAWKTWESKLSAAYKPPADLPFFKVGSRGGKRLIPQGTGGVEAVARVGWRGRMVLGTWVAVQIQEARAECSRVSREEGRQGRGAKGE
eukprot:363771-Chlamydomonas_euryale.AAC.18